MPVFALYGDVLCYIYAGPAVGPRTLLNAERFTFEGAVKSFTNYSVADSVNSSNRNILRKFFIVHSMHNGDSLPIHAKQNTPYGKGIKFGSRKNT